jgi:hypothetical protein
LSTFSSRLGVRMTAALLLSTAAPGDAAACPMCDAGTGQQVRAGLFDDQIGRNLLATLLPFPIVLGVVSAIHFDWFARRRGQPARPASDQQGAERGAEEAMKHEEEL